MDLWKVNVYLTQNNICIAGVWS